MFCLFRLVVMICWWLFRLVALDFRLYVVVGGCAYLWFVFCFDLVMTVCCWGFWVFLLCWWSLRWWWWAGFGFVICDFVV